MTQSAPHIAIVGAGIGGLAAALRLSHAGCQVSVFDQNGAPGGKMRTFPSDAGPVDAGPTVLTMREVFDDLFASADERLEDHVTLAPLEVLARHFWDDGTTLDLFADSARSEAAIAQVFGSRSAREFRAFSARARRLFDGFEGPMMRSAAPSQLAQGRAVAASPRLALDMEPWRTLAGSLDVAFSEGKLRQLFGRYATYVGGSPYASPAILSLIWNAEARGVWAVEGGMHRLAQALCKLAQARGAAFHFDTPVLEIVQADGKVSGLRTAKAERAFDAVLFNGDPRALRQGRLGAAIAGAVPDDATEPRSLSAYVHAFAASPVGLPLAHHNVFFARDPKVEFGALAAGRMPPDATLYVCAQDHGTQSPDALQRFEIIMNAPPVPRPREKETAPCQAYVFNRLKTFGLTFTPTPGPTTLTTPAGFENLCPASEGALYGRSPHGLMAAFKRPTARTAMPGLYLCGGGTHPGAGVPMATLSAQHAAGAILRDRTSILTSRRTATPGGTSTGSATAAPRPSPS